MPQQKHYCGGTLISSPGAGGGEEGRLQVPHVAHQTLLALTPGLLLRVYPHIRVLTSLWHMSTEVRGVVWQRGAGAGAGGGGEAAQHTKYIGMTSTGKTKTQLVGEACRDERGLYSLSCMPY